jgi:hypothetical protein
MGSSSYYTIFEWDNTLAMNRLVESTMSSFDKHVTLVASLSGPFYSVMLPLLVIRVALLVDRKGWPFQKRDNFILPTRSFR